MAPGTPEKPVMVGTILAAGHLGGYHVGGDPLSTYPALWSWLVDDYGVRSVIDVGCGEGVAVRFFRERGCEVLGVDGIEQGDPDIYKHDYTAGPFFTSPVVGQQADLAWCCEFVEHVEERYIPNFLATFACAELVLMSHAVPGQGGHHHVNCRDDDYWVGVLAGIGYQKDDSLTAVTRELAGEGYYTWSGLAFKRIVNG